MASLLGLLLIAVLSLGAAPDAAAGSETIAGTIAVNGDRMTVRVSGVSLRSVLRALEQRSGIRVAVDAVLDERISVAFENLPLAEAVKRLVGSRPVAFVYETAVGSGLRLLEVMVYPREGERASGADGAREPVESRPAEAARDRQLEAAPSGQVRVVGETELSDLLRVLKGDPSPDARQDALDALQGHPKVPAALLVEVALHDPAPSIRLKALGVLGVHPGADRPTIADVLRAASGDPDETVRDVADVLLENLVED